MTRIEKEPGWTGDLHPCGKDGALQLPDEKEPEPTREQSETIKND